MRKHLFTITPLLFFIVPPIIAQSGFPSSHGYWEGDWGSDTPFNIYLEPGENGAMSGTITWSLTYYDFKENKTIEVYPKEFLKGTWNEKTGLLMLNTVSEEDPHNLLVPGYYQMQMDVSGAVMKGFTTAPSKGGMKTEITMTRIRV